MLARVTPRALSALPGVFIVLPAKKAGGKGGAGKEDIDPELSGSNVLSVGEGVLLKWLSYHLEQANRVSVTLPRINVNLLMDAIGSLVIVDKLPKSSPPSLTSLILKR